MNSVIFVCTILGLALGAWCLTDKEITKLKQLVDAELLKRELDVLQLSINKKGEGSQPTASLKEATERLAQMSTSRPKPISTTSRPKPTSTLAMKTTEHTEAENFNSVDDCLDLGGRKTCDELVNKEKMDCGKDDLHKYCARTCGYCGVPMNPISHCSSSTFGCCPDGVTAKTDKLGTSCPECKDNAPELCPGFKDDCNAVDFTGEWMANNCKETCNLCGSKSEKCKDDPEHASYCPSWREEGFCNTLVDALTGVCDKTCEFCLTV